MDSTTRRVERRSVLLAGMGALAGSLLGLGRGRAAEVKAATRPATSPTTLPTGPAVDSPPVVQCASATGFSVAWSVRRGATGWVEWGYGPDLPNKTVTAAQGLVQYSDRLLSARIDGVESGKAVLYRAVTVPVVYKSAYKIERGEPEVSKTYRVRLPDPSAASASFAVIDDTHGQKETLAALFATIDKENSDFLVWNGDIFNDIRSEEQIAEYILRPAGVEYAAQRPVIFVPGNHDVRGVAARALPRAVLPWPGEELGKCFAIRHGPIAMIGLDTGEDKPDANPVFGGLAAFEPYREAQAEWLKKTVQRPEIAKAPFIVVFCHIPLWGLPKENSGETLKGFADYSGFGQKLWGPILEEARISLLVCGHTHKHRFDAPAPGHSYPQIVGGGPKMGQAVVICGRAQGEKMEVVVKPAEGEPSGRWEIKRR